MYIRITFAVALCLTFFYQIEAKPALSDEILSDLINLEKALVKRKLSLVTRDDGDQPDQGVGNPSGEQPQQAGNDGYGKAEGNQENGQGEEGRKGPRSEFEKELHALEQEFKHYESVISKFLDEESYELAAAVIPAVRKLLGTFVNLIKGEVKKQHDMYIKVLQEEMKKEFEAVSYKYIEDLT